MRFCKLLFVLLATGFLLSGVIVPTLLACYAVVAGKQATANGSVLVGHVEQNGPGKIFLGFQVVPRTTHQPGEMVVLKDGGRYPEPARSYQYLWSENFGLAGSDAVMNQWGVICVSNGTHTKEESIEDLRHSGDVVRGGINYTLRIEVAKRARTAREGIETFAKLIDRFGYGGSGTSFVIADPREAWIFSAVMGKRWVAQRSSRQRRGAAPERQHHPGNRLERSVPLPRLARPDFLCREKGWYDPKQGQPFNFREAPTSDARPVGSSAGTVAIPGNGAASAWLRGAQIPPPAPGPLPFAVKPNRKLTLTDVRNILSNHLEGTMFDKTQGYSRGSPHNLMSSSDGMICNLDNQEIALFQLRSGLPPEIGCVYWRTTAAGCSGVLTPWYAGITETPDAYHKRYDLKQNVTEAFHLNPPAATYDYDGSQAYWVFTDLMNSVDLDYKNGIEKVRPVWRAFESDEFAVQEAVEKTAGALYASDQQLAARFLTDYCAGRAFAPWKRPAK